MLEKIVRLLEYVCLCFCSFLILSNAFALPNPEGIQIYQNSGNLSPEHKQNLAEDISRYRNADNLWDVLRDEFSLAHYESNPIIQNKIEWFMNNQDFLLRSATRASPYLYYISQQVKKRHLPAELVLLPIIESGYNPFSLSPVGAAGVWQLMPETASGLGVKQDWWYDGRRDVITSTRAALNYLAYLQSFFEGNWLLAIAAYNTGEGNVLSAIRHNIREGRDTDFWSLPLAQQTKDYVPSLLALAVIISNPDRYPLYFPPVRNAPYLAQIDVGSQMSLRYAATLAGISYQKMMQLNPGFNRPATASKGPHRLVLPIENVEQFSENLTRSPLNRQLDWIHYRVKPGDTLASISKKFKTSPTTIRKMNHLASAKSTLKPKTKLILPNSISDKEANIVTFTKSAQTLLAKKEKKKSVKDIKILVKSLNIKGKYNLKPGDTVYMVRKTDSLETIANKFKLNSQLLKEANNLKTNKIAPGKQIIIPTHVIAQQKKLMASASKVKPGDTIYMVRRGDTLEKIAKKFHTTPAAIRLINLVDNSSINEGERIIIPTHLPS